MPGFVRPVPESTSGWPSRLPLDTFNVPMSCKVSVLLSVNSAPLWHEAQFSFSNTPRPAIASAVSEPSSFRCGLLAYSLREFTYAASASRSALTPALGSPNGVTLVDPELSQLVAYLEQIDVNEATAAVTTAVGGYKNDWTAGPVPATPSESYLETPSHNSGVAGR